MSPAWTQGCTENAAVRLSWIDPLSHHNPPIYARAICNLTEQNAGVAGSIISVGAHLVAKTALTNVTVAVNPLTRNGVTLPTSDVRVIQSSWRQSNGWTSWMHSSVDDFMSWLLVHNDALIQVDVAARTVTVAGQEKTSKIVNPTFVKPRHSTFSVTDSVRMSPVTLQPNTYRTLYIETTIPVGTPPGDYTGTVSVYADSSVVMQVPFLVRVYSFTFANNVRRTPGVYMEQVLDATLSDGETLVGSLGNVSAGHLLAMLEECARSGVNPTCHNALGVPGSATRTNLVQHLQLRQAAGLTGMPLFSLGISTHQYPQDAAGKAAIKADTQTLIALASSYGATDVYIYGKDEAPDQLTPDGILFDGVHEAGGRTFVSVSPASFGAMGTPSKLDLAIIAGIPTTAEVTNWLNAGVAVGKYGSPQSGAHSPFLYRLRYGFGLWALGGDSPFDWALSRYYHDAWNPFDHASYAEECFVMPSAGPAVIPTLAWRGYREAIYDLRYMDTLEAAIVASSNRALKDAAQQYLEAIRAALVSQYAIYGNYNPHAQYQPLDPRQIRATVVSHIVALTG